jgi:hypothetical protein
VDTDRSLMLGYAYSDSPHDYIKQVRPGLSGVGSIIYRGEKDIMHGATTSKDESYLVSIQETF